jgi:hypothetical protein
MAEAGTTMMSDRLSSSSLFSPLVLVSFSVSGTSVLSAGSELVAATVIWGLVLDRFASGIAD